MPAPQYRFWILTINRLDWVPCLPEACVYITGQPEVGESGYRHWQVMAVFRNKVTLVGAKRSFPETAHLEPTRSDAARAYVNKEETRDGDPFEFGELPIRRNNACDWSNIKTLAKEGKIDEIPADVYIRYYRTLLCIAADNASPVGMERTVFVYFGRTGTGKSRRAWQEAGDAAYSKDPRSKFWCGYRRHTNVVMDEFRGGIDISHLLRWTDRYPVAVELKGSSTPLVANKIWITSNVHPMNWYPELDFETKQALMRRLQITEFQ